MRNFWCLKKPNRLPRLIELAEFYQLDYRYWSQPDEDSDRDDGLSGISSFSSDTPSLSSTCRTEKVREYPECCHMALAATIGLVYSEIKRAANEDDAVDYRRTKRNRNEASGASAPLHTKPVKLPHGNPSRFLHKSRQECDGETHVDSQRAVVDKLGWDANANSASSHPRCRSRRYTGRSNSCGSGSSITKSYMSRNDLQVVLDGIVKGRYRLDLVQQ